MFEHATLTIKLLKTDSFFNAWDQSPALSSMLKMLVPPEILMDEVGCLMVVSQRDEENQHK